MADDADADAPKRNRRRLPPVTKETEGQDVEAKPKRVRKKKPPAEGEEDQPADRPRRRRRPKPQADAGDADIAADADGDPNGSRSELIRTEPEARPPRKKRVRKKRPAPDGQETGDPNEGQASNLAFDLDPDLGDLVEDIITDKDVNHPPQDGDTHEEDEEVSRPQHRLAPTLRSQPADRLYIESKSGFRSKDKVKYEQQMQAERDQAPEEKDDGPVNLTLEFALGVSKVYRAISLFCHGPFAGIAIMHCIFIWHFSTSSLPALLTNYAPFASGFSIAYYVLFVICTVSVCVRSDIGRPTRQSCSKCWTLQSGGISVLFYFTGFIVSNVMYPTDFLIQKHNLNSTYWSSIQNGNAIINQWRILDIVRCVFICLGWLVIALTPTDDRLKENLEAGIEEFLSGDGNEEFIEVKSSKV